MACPLIVSVTVPLSQTPPEDRSPPVMVTDASGVDVAANALPPRPSTIASSKISLRDVRDIPFFLKAIVLLPDHNQCNSRTPGRKGRQFVPLETQANIQALLLFRRNLPLRRDCLLLFRLHLRRVGAAVRYIMPQRGSQLLAVVGEDLRVVCAA